jgi:ParB-like chromosome segregation protein Spo0J
MKKGLSMEIKHVEISMLKPWDKNPRINDHAVDTVAKSIEQFGFNVPILCDKDMTIVAGHVRWKAAKKLGLNNVPIIQLSLSATQRKAFSIADNKTGEIADWDLDILSDILEEFPLEEIDISTLGFNEAEIEAILKPEEDFPWDEFQEDMEEFQRDLTHVFMPVKVPIDLKEDMKGAIREYAKQHEIIEKDSSRLAGLVFMSLLGMSPCKSH